MKVEGAVTVYFKTTGRHMNKYIKTCGTIKYTYKVDTMLNCVYSARD